ncbi:glycoside hydrolase family 55 protein [Blastococcus mobilis]|uniref:Pectate lyase superfamily protein n=1 Tax=Blastococcus mobilis TaxID=1938746 RepID=A0A238Z0L1_9ACTN|nr:glycoside hydrolase family 55 protein [Blastococcus mobilis]SNR76920.1 Pectate lyase superfamily protein [Blastococcus mobilis]
MVVAVVILLGLGLLWVTVGSDEQPGADGSPGGAGPAPSWEVTVPADAVDVRDFGATGDGVTDDAPAIRRALKSATAVHVPAGTYRLSSYVRPRFTVIDADFVFRLRDGQRITADPGAVFTMADGVIPASPAAWGGNMFLADGTSDVTISGLTLDMNGANNLVPAGRTITGYGLYLYAAERVTIEGVTMRDTPGQNYVVTQGGGSDIRVADSTFLNGGTSIPDNREQTDFSALYFTSTGVQVERIVIDHDEAPFTFSGGVELHGSEESVTDSEIRRSWPAVYIGPDVYSGLEVQRDIEVARNQFVDCGRGVVFNALGTGDIDVVSIVDNVFDMALFPAFEDEPVRAIDQDMPPEGNWTYHHIVTNLSISWNTFRGGGAASDATIRLSQIHSAVIVGNRMEEIAGTALELSSSPWDTRNVLVENNDIQWQAPLDLPAIALSFDGSSTTPRKPAFGAQNITVADNRIRLGGAVPGSCAVYANWVDGADVRDVVLRGNAFDDIDSATCGPQAGALSSGP